MPVNQIAPQQNAATAMRLMLAHMAVLNKRVMGAMVLDRLGMEFGMSTGMSTDP